MEWRVHLPNMRSNEYVVESLAGRGDSYFSEGALAGSPVGVEVAHLSGTAEGMGR